MSADFSQDTFKGQSRQYNLAQVRRSRVLVSRRTGKLFHGWAELAGEGARTLELLREEDMLDPAVFVGVEKDQDTYERLCAQYGPQSETHRFVLGNAEYLVRGRSMCDVGIFNNDTMHASGGQAFLDNLEAMFGFALEQRQRLGAFALIINVGLGRGYTLNDFRETLQGFGHILDESHLEIPGVLYRGHAANSRRVNYCIHFGYPVGV